MKRIIFLSLLLHATVYSIAQTAQLKIPEIGWNFTIPQGFDLRDSSTTTIKISPDRSIWNKRFVFTKQKNLFSAMLTRQPKETGNEREKMYTIEREQSYETLSKQHPTLRFDSVTTVVSIGNESFNKFTVTGKENNIPVFTHVEIHSFLKEYRFQIVYNVYEKETEAEIEKRLSDSKFIH